mmetsp:Transcript_21837/g.51797  ORF Transcript_21837/g.51797 Transcript_21837/m.51797 type:complete len:118 (-) Transcript_21837:476-829(-)
MVSRKIAFGASAISLLVLHFNICAVTSLSTCNGSRRDALMRISKIATVATTSSILSLDTLVANAAQEYQDGPEGLKYAITTEGTGPKPQRGQKNRNKLYALDQWFSGRGKRKQGKTD